MRYTIVALAAVSSFASAQSPSASASLIGAVVPVGKECTPGGTPCALGSQCYATNSMLKPVCGNFQASCTSDQQCAFNTCNGGLCNGFIASSSASAPAIVSSTPTGGYSGAPSPTISAPAGSLPLGAPCNPYVTPSQCANSAQCWASNAGLIAACGNFNAACTSDAQCAYNTCNNGICNGFKASSSSQGAMTSASGNATATVQPSRAATGSATKSTGAAQFTGAASAANVASSFMAIVLGSIAWVL